MKRCVKKLNVNKESLRVLSKPELTIAVGGDGNDTLFCANTVTCTPSNCVACNTDDCCGPNSNGF